MKTTPRNTTENLETQPTVVGTIERLAVREEEARAMLGGVSTTTLWRWRKMGLIRQLAGSRHKLYSVAELKRFVAQGGAA